MYTKSLSHLFARLRWYIAVVVFLLPSLGWAQQSSSSKPKEDKKAQAPQNTQTAQADFNQPDELSSSKPVAPPVPSSGVPQVRQIGKAGLLPSGVGAQVWGPLYIGSIDFSHAVDRVRFTRQDAQNPVIQNGTNALTSFQTTVAYDRQFRRSRLAVQYQPQLYIANGTMTKSLNNQNVTFDSYYQLSPRMTLSIGDDFATSSIRQIGGESFFNADPITGNVVHSPFLEGPSRSLSNFLRGSFGYQLSARSSLGISPTYSFTRTNQISTPGTLPEGVVESRNSLGVSVDYKRIIGADKMLGAFVSYGRSIFTGGFDNTAYESVGVNYAQRLGRTLSLQTSLGASTSSPVGQSRFWTVIADVGIIKQFRRSQIALAYARNHDLGIFVSNGYTDRLDIEYTRELTRRLRFGVGAGYERGLSLSHFSGTYYNADLNYALFPTVSWSFTYSFRQQKGSGEQVFRGSQSFVGTRISWTPHWRNRTR